MCEKILEIKNIKKYFKITRKKTCKAVDGVSFDVYKGEVLGIVGESGCGKSTIGKSIVRLHELTEGSIKYKGKSINNLSIEDSLKYCKKMQMIFQNPYSTLNPRMTVGEIIGEGLVVHKKDYSAKERRKKVFEYLELIGLNKDHYSRFPHEFSGGQRQRIGIARALAVNPEFIICDEPVSALDVSIRAQIINLLKKLKNDMDLTYIFISHDLNLVRYVSDRVVVMYLGSIVEQTGADKLYKKQYHPYTKALISSAPIADPKKQREKIFISLKGEIKSPINTPECCKFVDRCSKKMDVCYKKRPNLIEIEKNHFVACHLYN